MDEILIQVTETIDQVTIQITEVVDEVTVTIEEMGIEGPKGDPAPILYGTTDPPSPTGLINGTLYIKYIT